MGQVNIVLHNVKADDYYIVSLKVGSNADGYLAIGKRVAKDGRIISIGQPSHFPSKDARWKVRLDLPRSQRG